MGTECLELKDVPRLKQDYERLKVAILTKLVALERLKLNTKNMRAKVKLKSTRLPPIIQWVRNASSRMTTARKKLGKRKSRLKTSKLKKIQIRKYPRKRRRKRKTKMQIRKQLPLLMKVVMLPHQPKNPKKVRKTVPMAPLLKVQSWTEIMVLLKARRKKRRKRKTKRVPKQMIKKIRPIKIV